MIFHSDIALHASG